MADSKPELSRAGTMQVTAKEGQVFLDKNLTEWKKPYLTEHFDGDANDNDEETPDANSESDKPKLSKHTTMKATAKEADALLGSDKPDTDAHTRGQQKKLDDIKSEAPPAKKTKMAKAGTMAVTAKEGKNLLKGEKLADTRLETKARSGSKATGGMKRTSTIAKTMAEAEAVYGDLGSIEGRRTRSAGKPKPSLKRDGTMQATAKEGKAYLKRGRKPAKKAEPEPVEEDEEENEES